MVPLLQIVEASVELGGPIEEITLWLTHTEADP
jgi:hypothetical protein